MSEIFEALLKVEFPDSGSVTMSQARKDLDSQLKDLGGPLLQVRTKITYILSRFLANFLFPFSSLQCFERGS